MQRITAELQDRMLQQEISSQDQFLQLHTAFDEGQGPNGPNTPHEDDFRVKWKKGMLAGLKRSTSTRKTQEIIKINQKVFHSKIVKPVVFPSLIQHPLLVSLD